VRRADNEQKLKHQKNDNGGHNSRINNVAKQRGADNAHIDSAVYFYPPG